MRIAQIADMHLSPSHAYFFDNWEVVLNELNSDPPDLVVVDGDVSFNGADELQDLEFAREQLDRIRAPWVVLPGNHDIGDHPHSKKLDQPVNEERLRRWIDVFGTYRFSMSTHEWRIIGICSELMGSGLPEEERQRAWIDDEIGSLSEPAILFMHKPLFARAVDEPQFNKSCVDPASRKRLWSLVESSSIRLVASAHVHVYKEERVGDVEFCWCPATSFVVTWEGKDVFGGIRRAGYLEYKLSPSCADETAQISHEWKEPARLVNYDLRNWFRDYGSTVKMPPTPVRPQLPPLVSSPAIPRT